MRYFFYFLCLIIICIALLQPGAKPPKKLATITHTLSTILQPIHLDYIEDSLRTRAANRRLGIQIRLEPLAPNILGQCKQISPNHYLIQLSLFQTNKQLELTLLHELVHIKQFISHQLTNRLGNWYWHLEAIDWDQPYLTRPWEQQAFEESSQYQKEQQARHKQTNHLNLNRNLRVK